MSSNTQTNVAIEIIECRTGEVLHSIWVLVECWVDDIDRASAVNERVLRWCSDNGFAFGDEATWSEC